jgi:hypothetical protein
MTGQTFWGEPQVIAAIASAIAAAAAAIATWRGPIAAARMADDLRQRSETEAEKRRFKLHVFASLMQERAEIYSPDAVRALNSIDIVFSDSSEVREAWSELYQVLTGQTEAPAHVIDERIRKLLRQMAIDLGLSDSLRLDDFARVYFPNALADESKLRRLQRQTHLAQLNGQSGDEANDQTSLDKKWPPKPKD